MEAKFTQRKVVDLITNRELFILVYVSICILWFFPLLGWIINPLSKVCFIWGLFIIIKDFFVERKVLDASYWYWLVALIFSYGITILINFQNSLYSGIKNAIYASIFVFVLYVHDGNNKTKNIKRILKMMNKIILCIIFMAGVISLGMFLAQVGFQFKSGETTLRQGFLENRLFGVYTSPNTGALFSVISIALMCLDSALDNRKLFQWNKFYKINAIIQMIYFALTLSKGGHVTLITFIVLQLFFFFLPRLLEKKKIVNSIVVFVTVCVLAILSINIASKCIQFVMGYAAEGIQMLIYIEDKDEDTENDEKIKFERIETDGDTSNGRLTIWAAGLKVWRQSPLFGVADAKWSKSQIRDWKYSLDSMSQAEKYWFFRSGGNMHNSYIQILVMGGSVGLLCFLVFIILAVKRYLSFILLTKHESNQYRVIACIASLLGAMGANGMVENHLLYNHQDPYGAIFWCYLGVGMILINKYQKTSEYKDNVCKDRRNAFVCDTPIQIMNSINIVMNTNLAKNSESDIYIIHQFGQSKEISENVKKSKIFKNVYDVQPIIKELGIKSKFSTLKRMLCPKYFVENQSGAKKRVKYRYLCISFQSPFAIAMRLAHTEADVVLIEDGIGTYISNIENDFTSSLFKIMNKYFLEYRGNLNPVSIYLNRPDLLIRENNYEKIQLPPIITNLQTLEILETIFMYDKNMSNKNLKCMYLTQPLNEVKGYIQENEVKILQSIKGVFDKKELALRVHPRQNEYDTNGIDISCNKNLWELECIYNLSDDNILISGFSTTLCMPKILNDKEPALIFVYKLLFEDWKINKAVMGCKDFIERFAATYRSSNKIYMPESFEELDEILIRLNNNSK